MKSLGQRAHGLRLERMKASPQWQEDGFRNIFPIAPGLRDPSVPFPGLTDFLLGGKGRVPSAPLPMIDPRESWRHPPHSGLRATWLGHSTVLLEIGGMRVLTDPVWGSRASPLSWAGPKRFQPVPLSIQQLPPIDAVFISHDHYDHLDYPTIRALNLRRVPFVTSLGVGAHLQAWGVPSERIVELDWWEEYRLPGSEVTMTAAPAQHFSGRSFKDRNATLWSSLAVRSDRHRVFFSGDTGLSAEYQTIRERLGPFDLVLLEIGAFHPAWGDMHLGPDNAMKAHTLLGGGALLPVHWATFRLSTHTWDQPAEVLHDLAERNDVPLLMPLLGQPVEPARQEKCDPWWRRVETQSNAHAGQSPEAPHKPLLQAQHGPLD